MVTEHVFEDRHSGAPGIAHGGVVATVVDDVLGFLLYVAEAPGVTRRLEVDYLRPVLTGVPYRIRGRIERREGRKLFVTCEGRNATGEATFRAHGLFVLVELSHFSAATAGNGGRPVAP